MNNNIVSGKILYLDDDYIVTFFKSLTIRQNATGQEFIITPPIQSSLQKLGLHFRLGRRLMRLEPRYVVRIPEKSEFLMSFHGNAYIISLGNDGSSSIENVYSYRHGMNNPLNIAYVNDVEGFPKGFYFGDYWGNPEKASVGVHFSPDGKSWSKVFELPTGAATHIHNIVPDSRNSCIYVLTGDLDDESAIYECRAGFSSVEKVVSGSQDARACVLFPTADGFVYATDSPVARNSLYKFERGAGVVTRIADLEGSVIYSSPKINGLFYFATAVEGDSNKRRINQFLSCKSGPGIVDQYSYVHSFNPETGQVDFVMKGKKDAWPFVFQFGTFMFPHGAYDHLSYYGMALGGYDGASRV